MCYDGKVKEVAIINQITLILSLIYTIYEKKYYSDSFLFLALSFFSPAKSFALMADTGAAVGPPGLGEAGQRSE